MIPIVPAVIPRTADEIRTLLPKLRFSPEIHIDVVDGEFVPFVSWPYEPIGSPEEVKSVTDSFTLEVDLMVKDPLTAAAAWLKAGADMLVFHTETISVDDFAYFMERNRVSVSISAINDTSLETLLPYMEYADGVQCMGIAKIGSQGQPFDERTLERIAAIKKRYPYTPITVDGSVNSESIVRLKEAGADRFICGSAIVKAADPAMAHQRLQDLITV
jgi:ribulose-phosphate 3-epimerase